MRDSLTDYFTQIKDLPFFSKHRFITEVLKKNQTFTTGTVFEDFRIFYVEF